MDDDLSFVAAALKAKGARRGERIQSLWAGYGEIVRVHLEGAAVPSVVLKRMQPPRAAEASSHMRKVRSYVVEAAFYRNYAARCEDDCRVARLFAHRDGLLVLEDLHHAGFVERRHSLEGEALDACLAWLAAFHARFLGERPAELWPIGTYWHLDTRREELANIRDRKTVASAGALDARLNAATFQTFVHGDAKPANFCFTRGAKVRVAAVDFQYVGGGCGMKDVAYLLYERADLLSSRDAPKHLDRYFALLRTKLANRDIDLDALEREWRSLYPIARADFDRFLAGWRPG